MSQPEKPIEWPKLDYAEADGKTCPVKMFLGKRCGQPLHTRKYEEDDHHVCLMHTRDLEKNNAAFQQEFERILADGGDGLADFAGFVFPESVYDGRKFRTWCNFAKATFTQDAAFGVATFTQAADFSEAKFTQDTNFMAAKFTQAANFRGARFTQDAYFAESRFTQDANFANARFTQAANFIGARFTQDADFGNARFTQDAYFSSATFTQEANFRGATFTQAADFSEARFTQAADFSDATFTQDADFRRATFTQAAHFSEATFTRAADFRRATFKERVEFRETTFREDETMEPGPIFSRAQFEKPEQVAFYRNYLGQALFHNCDVSKVSFSTVRWRGRSKYGKSGKRMLFEEVVDLGHNSAGALWPRDGGPKERNYELISELYQQLKKNYDDRRDYWTAGDFHYGELEMKRKHSPRRSKFLRGWHRNLGLLAWYKYASNYGESYPKAGLWLVFFFFAFVLSYPAIGLEVVPPAGEGAVVLSYESPVDPPVEDPSELWWAWVRLVGKSAVAALQYAIVQRELKYLPAGDWGGFLRAFQVVLVSTLFALFLLAVRRQVRR